MIQGCGRYVKFQAPYKGQLDYLKNGQFEKPVTAADGDKWMPCLLIRFDIKVRQGTKEAMTNFDGNLSCVFDAERIAAYGAANANFKADMLMPVSIPKLYCSSCT